MKDSKGRIYAPVAATTVGCKVQVNGDFACMKENATKLVLIDNDGLYIKCNNGKHHLDGQLSPCETYYTGLYLVL